MSKELKAKSDRISIVSRTSIRTFTYFIIGGEYEERLDDKMYRDDIINTHKIWKLDDVEILYIGNHIVGDPEKAAIIRDTLQYGGVCFRVCHIADTDYIARAFTKHRPFLSDRHSAWFSFGSLQESITVELSNGETVLYQRYEGKSDK